MLKTFAIGALALSVLAGAVLAYAATTPAEFRIARSAIISAPPENIFPLINNLHAFNAWNSFLKMDRAAKLSYSGPESGKGAAHEWDGNSDVGKGRLEITDSSPSSKISMKLQMIKPMEAYNRVEFTLEPKDGGTQVTWTMNGENSFIGKVMGLCFNMEKMVGGAFENGLADLKVLAEK